MYVCVCKAVSDRRIRALAQAGKARTLAELRRETGLGSCCGRCVPCARSVLAEALARTEPAAAGRIAVPSPAPA